MIKSLIIKNFQSHKKTKLEFDKGINIIIGQSDSGKSAILRALSWNINNKPSGDAFRSNWGGDTQVKIRVEDKTEVLRYKTKKVPNGYQIHYPTKVKKKTGDAASTFRSFGQDVPEEIKQVLNFSPLNMSRQFDSPFLLDMSGGEVARYLNKIVHLDVIDKSLSNISKTLSKEKTDLKYKEEELLSAEEKAKEFSWIDEAEGCLEKLEAFERTLISKKKDLNKLAALCLSIEKINENIDKLNPILKHEEEVNELISKQKKIRKLHNTRFTLENIIDNLRQINNSIIDIDGGVKGWQKDFDKLMPNVCPLCEK